MEDFMGVVARSEDWDTTKAVVCFEAFAVAGCDVASKFQLRLRLEGLLINLATGMVRSAGDEALYLKQEARHYLRKGLSKSWFISAHSSSYSTSFSRYYR
jgi:hypothetical protein